jgi:hypothetical protein
MRSSVKAPRRGGGRLHPGFRVAQGPMPAARWRPPGRRVARRHEHAGSAGHHLRRAAHRVATTGSDAAIASRIVSDTPSNVDEFTKTSAPASSAGIVLVPREHHAIAQVERRGCELLERRRSSPPTTSTRRAAPARRTRARRPDQRAEILHRIEPRDRHEHEILRREPECGPRACPGVRARRRARRCRCRSPRPGPAGSLRARGAAAGPRTR